MLKKTKRAEIIFNKLSRLGLLVVYFYQRSFALFLGGACRFQPSCSEYAVSALKTSDFPKAVKLIIKRLLKCQPFGPYGYDPVPCCEKKDIKRQIYGK